MGQAGHKKRARKRNFVCSQYLALVSALLSFGTNVFISVSCDVFLVFRYFYMHILIIADGTYTIVLGVAWRYSFL